MRQSQEIGQELAGLLQTVVNNSPGKMLPAHKRYALSLIADGQSERIISDGYNRSAAEGVSPEAHSANQTADALAAQLGIQPPPMPTAQPQQAQQGQDQGSYNGTVEGQNAQGPGTATPAQPANSGTPPPGTRYDPVTRTSIWDPNYHGHYMDMAEGGPVGTPAITAQPSPTTTGTQNQDIGAPPVQQFASLDQKRIDEGWQKFHTAMSRMPTPPDPSKMPEIGLTHLIAMAVAGIIDPQSAAVIGKAIFEAPVLAKGYIDQQNDKRYASDIQIWQNETLRYEQAALGVERSVTAQKNNEQDAYTADFNRKSILYGQAETQQHLNDREYRVGLRTRLSKLDSIASSGKLSANDLAQLNDTRNYISSVLDSGLPAFNAHGQPTQPFKEAEKRMAEADSRIGLNAQRVKKLASAIGLDKEKAERLDTLLPLEAARMAAQTGLLNADRVNRLYNAVDAASKIDYREYRQGLEKDKFELDKVKVGFEEVGKRLKEAMSSRDANAKAAAKAQESADARLRDYKGKDGTIPPGDKANEYKGFVLAAKEAQAKVDAAAPAIDELNRLHSRLKDGLDLIVPTEPTSSGTTIGSVSSMAAGQPHVSGFIEALKKSVGKPYVWGGGRKIGDDETVDCSGLVCNALESIGLKAPGSTAQEMYKNTAAVNPGEMQPGDLLFFDWKKDGKVDHVTVYIGNDRMIGASSKSKKVEEVSARGYVENVRQGQFVKIGRIQSLTQGGAPSPSFTPGTTKRVPRGAKKVVGTKPPPGREAHYGSQDTGGK